MNDGALACLGFELAYLALLTRSNIKRLSRWEAALSPEQTATLRDLGLEVAEVRRKLLFGRKTQVTVFSTKRRWTDLYRARFDMTRMRTSPDEIRLKGFLFGYPGCCVDAFIREPYSKNSLRPSDQEMLFHWACRGCRVTPGLLDCYRDIHGECLDIFGPDAALRGNPFPDRGGTGMSLLQAISRRRAAPIAAGLSALLLMPFGGCTRSDECCGPGIEHDHLIGVEDDADHDFLSFAEEILAGTGTTGADTDGDGTPDGIQLARAIRYQVGKLPDEVSSDRPYAVYGFTYGSEVCTACGERINMGGVSIVNPMRQKSMSLPLICLHYLECGSLSYDGSTHAGRLDLARFRRNLPEVDPSHAVTEGCEEAEDIDGDGLCDEEETLLGTDPAIADSDGDSVMDGPQMIEDLLEAIANLPREPQDHEPYLVEHYQRGIETCEICGARFNMGYATIVNPDKELSIDIPWVALHYLAHGSFSHRGTDNTGRVSPVLLSTILDTEGSGD